MCGVIVSSRNKLDDLLARGRLSGPRRERIFEEVHRQVRGGSGRSKYWKIAGPLALAAALVLVLRGQSEGPDRYASKGIARANVVVGCSGGEISHCPRGSKLIFHLDALEAPGFLHAYAEPLEAGAERVWYYPTPANPPPRVEPVQGGQTMTRGIAIGAEHASGSYRLHLVIASAPLSREELLHSPARNILADDVVEMVIVDP